MKRLIVLCLFIVGCGVGTEIGQKEQGIGGGTDYALDWIDHVSNGMTCFTTYTMSLGGGAYQIWDGSFVAPGGYQVSFSWASANKIDSHIAAPAGGGRGFRINTSSASNGTIDKSNSVVGMNDFVLGDGGQYAGWQCALGPNYNAIPGYGGVSFGFNSGLGKWVLTFQTSGTPPTTGAFTQGQGNPACNSTIGQRTLTIISWACYSN